MDQRIIIPAEASFEERYTASELRAAIAEYQGITSEIICDSGADGDIYIGDADMPEGDGYVIRSEGDRVYICAGSAYGYEAAMSALREELRTKESLDGITSLSGDGVSLRTCGAKRAGRVRYMNYNVYGWNNKKANTTPAERQPFQLSLLRSYNADILAFQEFGKHYRKQEFLGGLEALGYTEVGNGELRNEKGTNLTPLFYRADTLKVVACGYRLFGGANDVSSKSVTWAVFERNDDKKRFIAMCTHFMWNDPELEAGVANKTRCSNAVELTELLADIRAEHGNLPMIVGGDLNCSYGRGDTEPLDILAESGLVRVQSAADDSGCALNSVNGHGAYAVWDTEAELFITCPSHSSKSGEWSIDHVWQDGLLVELFATVTDRYACLSSDHSPKITDFSIN
ncbi:MAG: hypothetical protein IJY08_03525 [Clostridia bacterium]|nr:hypothetical protein [Clostridia bacterium]